MADVRRTRPENVPGDFFIDTTCIDCPSCRQIAPTVFGDASDQAVVVRQPTSEAERLRACMALVSCPAGSIGTRSQLDVRSAFATLPEPIEDEVYACGFASPDSYGAQSYFIRRSEGNVLVDSPRFASPLVKRLEAMGGIRFMFLTHRDDVADHEEFRRHFECERVIHEDEADGDLNGIERKLGGNGPWALGPDLKVIATPSHTKGHAVLLYRNKFLFTGDHIRGDGDALHSSRRYNWYSWEEQIKSVEKLVAETFSWVLPGHGYRWNASPEKMRREIFQAVARMRA